ncbi:hypothetical protein ERO13_D08G224900v2 [Gossypium hirsutum]|nr:hypothetical protein ERO13_D08G224900v2 [Gossypium hirsutum]
MACGLPFASQKSPKSENPENYSLFFFWCVNGGLVVLSHLVLFLGFLVDTSSSHGKRRRHRSNRRDRDRDSLKIRKKSRSLGKRRRKKHSRHSSDSYSSSDSDSSRSNSSSDSDNESSHSKRHKKSERQKKSKEKERSKSYRHRRQKNKLKEFLGRDKDDGTRRSVVSGKKILLKLDKSKEDKAAESKRNELLKFLNASFD